MAAWTQGNKALTQNVLTALAAKGEMWRQITFMLAGNSAGFCVLVGTDGNATDDDAATRKGVTIYDTANATAEGPFAGIKRHTVEGPVDLSKLAAVTATASQVLHWFGHKLGAE